MRRLLLVFGLVSMTLLAFSFPSAPAPARAAGPSLLGGGSSFAKLEIDQWRADVKRAPFDLDITYSAQGSTYGRESYIAGTFDFAASDIPFTALELDRLNGTNRKDFAYVPVSAGGLGFMFNLKDVTGAQVTDLKLSRRTVCRMFTEAGMTWADGEIAASNPGLRLPAELVRPIVRSDGSGTSYVFSEFCIAVAPDVWQTFISSRSADTSLDPLFFQNQPVSNWPQGWGASSAALAADGVAQAVADPTGLYAITYNEAGFAKIRGFPNASVENAAGQYTQPTEDAVSTALGYAQPRGNGTFILNFTGGDPAAYFPSTYSYVIAQTTGFDAAKGEVLSRFLCYAVTKGQRKELTERLGYARLSAPLVEIARESIARIPGAPPWEQCRVESDAPPPAPTTTTTQPAQGGETTTTVVGGGGGATTTTPPASQTSAPTGTTPSGGTNGGGNNSGGPVTTAPRSGSTTTSIAVDPDTGETVIVTSPPDVGECIDEATGEPLDPLLCTDDGSGVGPITSDGGAVGGPSTAPIPNPPVADTDDDLAATTVTWWLLQGASVCAVGVGLAGLRQRGAT